MVRVEREEREGTKGKKDVAETFAHEMADTERLEAQEEHPSVQGLPLSAESLTPLNWPARRAWRCRAHLVTQSMRSELPLLTEHSTLQASRPGQRTSGCPVRSVVPCTLYLVPCRADECHMERGKVWVSAAAALCLLVKLCAMVSRGIKLASEQTERHLCARESVYRVVG